MHNLGMQLASNRGRRFARRWRAIYHWCHRVRQMGRTASAKRLLAAELVVR